VPSVKLNEIAKIDPAAWDRINDNFRLIEDAIGRMEGAIAGLAKEVVELRAALPVGGDEPNTD
jgi:hypothetical protein